MALHSDIKGGNHCGNKYETHENPYTLHLYYAAVYSKFVLANIKFGRTLQELSTCYVILSVKFKR